MVSILEKERHTTVVGATCTEQLEEDKNKYDADKIQNFKRSKLEIFFGGDKRRPKNGSVFEHWVTLDSTLVLVQHTWKNAAY